MNSDEYKKEIFNPKVDKILLLSHLKKEGDIDKIKKVFRNISTHPFVKSSLSKNNEIYTEYSSLSKWKRIPNSGNFIGECAPYFIAFEQNKAIVESFINLKEDFDKEILLENYEHAQIILEEIEKLSGKSYWLIQNKILLKEYKEGVKENWSEVSELTKSINDPFVLFFIENFSKRAEAKISYFRYNNIFNNQVDPYSLGVFFYEYLYFRLNYIAYEDYEHFAYFLFVESNAAVVDRYLLIKEVLSELFSEKFKSQRDILFSLLNKLFDLFPNDKHLIQMLSLLSSSYFKHIPRNTDISGYIENYSLAKYSICIEQAIPLILKYPTYIELYEIYIKSLLENKLTLPDSEIPQSINTILKIIFEVFSNDLNLDQSVDNARKISISFSSTHWSKQLISLLIAATSVNNGNKLFTINYIINSQINNPRILYYVDSKNIDEYLNTLSDDQGLISSATIIKNIITGQYSHIEEDKNLIRSKKELFYGRALLKALKYEEAKNHFEKLYLVRDKGSLYNEEIIVNLYRCYIKLDFFSEACKLFVENYLKNKETVKRFNVEHLLTSLESGQRQSLQNNIELPIFYKIASTDTYLQYVAYDIYLESLGFIRPTQIIETNPVYDTKLIYFLKEVCTTDVMHYSYHYTGTDDLENERLKVLNALIVEDKINEDIYIKEITTINQNANIRKAIREVNRGRITVNIDQLRSSEANNIKEAFNRFKEIEVFSKTKTIVGIDSTASLINEAAKINSDESALTKIVYTSDPAFISFKAIFLEIRDKFILSKEYGLDGYLSTRIRHGTLLNHVRSIFEAENIISQRDKVGNYMENDFWNNSIPYSIAESGPKIQDAIKKFSRSIDEYTEFIIKELIQIKTEKYTKNVKGLFDFTITGTHLAYMFNATRENIKDHNSFLSFVFEFLQTYTEQILTRIRGYINTEIKNHYNKLLQDFNTEVKIALNNSNYPEITNAISLCGTRIQNELKNISEWFYLSNTPLRK